MANYCSNNITAGSTNSEWKEIAIAFSNDQIDWPASMDGTECNKWSKEIHCTTKWSPTPWDEGKMAALSQSYPSVKFHYKTDIEGEYRSPSAWFCNGEETDKKGAESNRKQAYRDEVQRFVNATKTAAEGIIHRVELMPDGRVAADGENRFGECNIFSWTNISEISCGNWHTVGLKNDGTVVSCGSNANGQCDVSSITGKAVAVSCGRYHTAILLENGRVVIKGELEQEAQDLNVREESSLEETDFPLVLDLSLDKYITGWEKMNERIENISAGDDLTLKKVSKEGEITFEVLNMRGEKIGNLYFDRAKGLAKLLKGVKATVATVTPLSQRRKGSKYAAMTIRLDYISSGSKENTKKASTTIGDYKQTRIAAWPPVSRIKSVFDAVIGVTNTGEIYIDGFCPCSESDINKIFGIE